MPDPKAIKNIKRAVEIFRAEGVGFDRAAHHELARTHSSEQMNRLVMAYDRELKIVQANEHHDYWIRPRKLMQRAHDDRMYSSPHRDHLIWHEIGHAKHDQASPHLYLALNARAIWATSEWRNISLRVSHRAGKNALEFVAEVFAARRLGVAIDDVEVLRLYNTLGGPP